MQPAVATVPGSGRVELIEVKPRGAPGPGQVRLAIERVGICGTDRKVARGWAGVAPAGHKWLIMGHEALGTVEEVGSGVEGVAPGDLVMPLVREGCGECAPCRQDEPDMCRSGQYGEHGIVRLDGFLTPRVLHPAGGLVHAPPALGPSAILAEPLATPEKAVDVLRRSQRRVDHPCPHPEHGWDQPGWGGCKTALVAGLGPIGLLMALKLRLEGVATWLVGPHDPDEPRVRFARAIGAHFLDLRRVGWDEVGGLTPDLDLVFEMSGVGEVAAQLPALLGPNGCLIFVGAGGPPPTADFDFTSLTRQLVRRNQAMHGIINCKRRHVEEAMADLQRARERYGTLLDGLITRTYRLDRCAAVLADPAADDIKSVIEP